MEKIIFSHFKKNMLANSFLISFRYAMVAAIGLATSVAFARLSTKEIFGQYQFVLSILAFFSVFSLPGLNLAALKSVSHGEIGVVSQAVRLSFFGGILATPFLVGYGVYVLFSGNHDIIIGWSCIVFGFLFPLLNAPNTWYVYYEGRLRFLPVVVRVIGSSALTALLLFLGLWNRVGMLSLISIWFFTSILFSWFFYWEVAKEEQKNKSDSSKLDVRYGLRVTAQKFVVSLTENIPIIAISFFLGFEAVANFQVASVFVGAVSGLLGALTAMTLPVIFSDINNKHSKLLLYSIFSGIIASLGYALFVEILFLFVYGNQYYESLELARLFIFIPFLVSLRLYFSNIFTARGESYRIVLVYGVANVISIVLFLIALNSGVTFRWSAGIYLYSVNLFILLPFALFYFFDTTGKKDFI